MYNSLMMNETKRLMKAKNVFLKPRGVPYYVKATDPDSGLSHVAYFPRKKEAVAFFLYCVTMNRNPAMGWSRV